MYFETNPKTVEYVGSRRGGSFQELAGSGAMAKIRKLRETIRRSRPARIVVRTGVDTIASSTPLIGGLVATYRFTKSMYPIVSKTYETYRRTRDPKEALKTLATETTKYAISETRDQIIGNYVDVSWKQIKDSAKIETSELTDRILTNGATNALSEVLP